MTRASDDYRTYTSNLCMIQLSLISRDSGTNIKVFLLNAGNYVRTWKISVVILINTKDPLDYPTKRVFKHYVIIKTNNLVYLITWRIVLKLYGMNNIIVAPFAEKITTKRSLFISYRFEGSHPKFVYLNHWITFDVTSSHWKI